MKKSLLIISLMLGHFLSFAQIDHTRGIWDVFENEEYNYIPSSGILDSRNGHRLSPHGEIPVLPNLQFGSREASICNAG